MHKSKKGDVPIVVLVFMVLFLCAAALFIFVISNSSYERRIANIGFVNELSAEKINLEYSMQATARDIIQKNPEISSEDFIRFFKKEYSLNAYKGYLTQDEIYQIEHNSYDVKIEGNELKFVLKDFRFSKNFEVFSGQDMLSASYKTDISFEIRFQ